MSNLPVEEKPSTDTAVFQFPEVRVVEASAGSGKTYALARRYIQLLLKADAAEAVPIRNILAITFTNKAAFEMKARILDFLKRIALGAMPEDELYPFIAPAGISPQEAQKKAFAVMEGLIHQYNFFQVQTIDKFINALLAGCAFKIGLTANFRIKTNAREYLEYSLDELIDRAPSDKGLAKLFDEFLHQYLYLENRIGWFPKDDMLAILAMLFGQNNTYGRGFKESPYTAVAIIKHKKKILEQMRRLHEDLPGGTDKRFVIRLEKFLRDRTDGFDIDALSDYFARPDFPSRKDAEVPFKIGRLWGQIHEGLREACVQEAYSLFDPYVRIFQGVMEAFKALSGKDDCLFLGELNQKAGNLFDEDYVTVEELYYRLATRFRHYLVDEFQDTSRLQWHNLQKMTEEALSTGGSLFYVGDRKQAIYGFRGGDAALFDDVKVDFAPFNVKVDRLQTNWRSQKAVVDFNNAVFAPENLERFILEKEAYEREKNKKGLIELSDEGREEILHIFANARQDHRPGHDYGYVRLEAIDGKTKEQRDEALSERLLALIPELRKRFRYRDIAILTRSNAEVEHLTTLLLANGIPVESERTSNIQENPLIIEIMAFLRFLNSPIDDIAFASFILGDIFSRATGIASAELHEFTFNLRYDRRTKKNAYVYTEFRARYPQVWEKFLDEFFGNVGLYPLYELVVSFFNRFALLKYFSEAQGFLMHFLELVRKREDEHSDIASFLDYFENMAEEDMYIHVPPSDTVRVFTGHKAKGLEFPVVILPFLGIEVQVGSSSEQNQVYAARESEGKIELVRLKKQYLKFSDDLYVLYRDEYQKALANELSNVYVAMTRPQYELYGFLPEKIGQGVNLARFLIPEKLYETGTKVNYVSQKTVPAPVEILPVSTHHDWIQYLKEEFEEREALGHEGQIRKGNALHYILSQIKNCDRQDAATALAAAVDAARLEYPRVTEWDAYGRTIEDLLKSPAVQPFFYASDAQIFTERDIVTPSGDTRRPDRLIVTPKKIVVLDYKLSPEAAGKYQRQVSEYMELVAGMYPGRKVKGYLVYIESKKVEEVCAQENMNT